MPKRPGKKGHDKYIGANVLALRDTGQTQEAISTALGVPQTTVADIICGNGKWASLIGDTKITAYRNEQRRKHELMAHELSTVALQRIEKTLPYASVHQAVIAFGVLQEKIQLLAGESTQNIRVAVSVEADKLTETLNKLVTSLREEKSNDITTIDITPETTNGELPDTTDVNCTFTASDSTQPSDTQQFMQSNDLSLLEERTN